MNEITMARISSRIVMAMIVGVFLVACGGGGGGGDRSGLLSASYNISGVVSGDIKAGVSVSLIGSTVPAVTSDANGNFSFSSLVNGDYTVAPSLNGYTFSPSSMPIVVAGTNVTGKNFVATANATPSYSLSGTITGGVKQKVLITLSGGGSATATTDANGYYILNGLKAASYVVTPSKLGYTFSPVPPTVVISNSNISGTNFTAIGMLNDTGITSNQCFQLAASSVFASCSNSFATTLNNAQDGMVGRDVLTPIDNNNGQLGFDFTSIAGGACIQDNVTGLMWESKTTAPGLHNLTNTYTNYSATYNPANLYGTATDASGLIAAVNSEALCGFNDWRMPAADELQSIVNFGVTSGASVDPVWFPNTQASVFWSDTPNVDVSSSAWFVDFGIGSINNGHIAFTIGFIPWPYWQTNIRGENHYVRLVRTGQ